MSPAGARYLPSYAGLGDEVPHGDHGHTLAITRARLDGGFLIVEYTVRPVPDALAEQRNLIEGDNAGIAIDHAGRSCRDCRSGYRVSRAGNRIVGVLRIGPALWRGRGETRVLFAPFAHTLGLRRALCEVDLTIDVRDRVDVSAVRSG